MVGRKFGKQAILVMAVVLVAMMLVLPAGAQEHAEGVSAGGLTTGDGLRSLGLAIGAGLAILGGALGTGRAQGAIGAGGTGAIAEKPELFGRIFILVALPETVVVLGFVVGLLLWIKI